MHNAVVLGISDIAWDRKNRVEYAELSRICRILLYVELQWILG